MGEKAAKTQKYIHDTQTQRTQLEQIPDVKGRAVAHDAVHNDSQVTARALQHEFADEGGQHRPGVIRRRRQSQRDDHVRPPVRQDELKRDGAVLRAVAQGATVVDELGERVALHLTGTSHAD